MDGHLIAYKATRGRLAYALSANRLFYFGYDELSDVMLPVLPNPVDADQVEPEAPPAASDQSISPVRILPQLFSDHERVRSPSPQISSSDKESSLPGTSASLLPNPSLTTFLSNYPIWPTAPPIPLKSATDEGDVQPKVPDIPAAWPGAETAPSFKRGRGRPPKAQKKRLVRAKARTRKKETPTNDETEVSAETAVQAETENLKICRGFDRGIRSSKVSPEEQAAAALQMWNLRAARLCLLVGC